MRILLVISLLLYTSLSSAQLIVAEVNGGTLVRNVLVGNGIETRSIDYTGYSGSLGYFDNGLASGLPLDEGIMLTTGVLDGVKGPNREQFFNSGNHNTPGSPLLNQYATRATGDAAILEFQFKPMAKDVVFNYVFASEEYTFYVDQGVNDIFGFFISGPNIAGEQNVALLPGTNIPVAVDNVNHLRNQEYYINNPHNNSTSQPVLHEYLQPNGFTTSLRASLELVPCEWYTIKLAIADVGDKLLDSWVFIEAESFKHKTLLGNDTFFCAEGFTHTLDAGHPGKRVEWSTGDTTQKITVSTFGTYWVDVYTACGKFRDEVTLRPAISDIDLGPDTFVCGTVLDKTLRVSNRRFHSYLWSDGSTADSLRINQPGLYWLEVERFGCKGRDSIFIEGRPLPSFSLGADSFYCGEFSRSLNPNIAADSFVWNDGWQRLSRNISSPGNFSLQLFKDGCSFSDTLLISQVLPFDIDLGPDITICKNDAVPLKSGLIDTSVYEFSWNTGSSSPKIEVTGSGLYTLNVRDKRCGFTSSDEILVVIVEGSSGVFVPNAFSPDDDGLNNTFQPFQQFATIQSYQFSIYNLWGELLYRTNRAEDSWDGKQNGELLPEGTYIWTLEIRSNCIPPEEQFKRGTVMLFR